MSPPVFVLLSILAWVVCCTSAKAPPSPSSQTQKRPSSARWRSHRNQRLASARLQNPTLDPRRQKYAQPRSLPTAWVPSRGGDRLRDGYEWDEPKAPHEDGNANDVRRLSSGDHEDVSTDIVPADDEVEADWDHDYQILKPVLEERGISTSGASKLCELPRVYCDYGYRRRVPSYAAELMDDDWVGRQYQLIMLVEDESVDNVMNQSLFNLRRVSYFHVEVNAGEMPSGIGNLPSLAVAWITGAGPGGPGLVGTLPDDFWSIKTRMLGLVMHGRDFLGALPLGTMPACDYLDSRLYLYAMPAFSGNISVLKQCYKLESSIQLYATFGVYGNGWEVALALNRTRDLIDISDAALAGPIPYADQTFESEDQDPWVAWCRAQTGPLTFKMGQDVNGPLPRGFGSCSNILESLDLRYSGITGTFPLNFSNNTVLGSEGILLTSNNFEGPIPEVPPQTEAVYLAGNRWSGDIPASWHLATSLVELDLTDCQMTGSLPNVTLSMQALRLGGNQFESGIPDSWTEARLSTIVLSDNKITGPPFPWAWQGADTNGNYDGNTLVEVYIAPPSWPLAYLDLSGNALGISVGFLMGLLGVYQLEELYISNCSLHGYVTIPDLEPDAPLVGGGTREAGGVAYTRLRTLDLSYNNIENFGYMQSGTSVVSCWAEAWDSILTSLDSLNLAECQQLLRLPSKAYTLSSLDLSGTTSLAPLPVVEAVEDCETVFELVDEYCPVRLMDVCMYILPQYTTFDNHVECADITASTQASEFHPSITIDISSYSPTSTCRCEPGYTWEVAGSSCVNCPINTYRSEDMEECTACPNSSTTPELSDSEDSRRAGLYICKCEAGFFMSNGVCERCPQGTFSTATGATSMDSCIHCPSGTNTGEEGGFSNSSACVCPAGKTTSSGGCVACAVGKYKSSLGNEACSSCTLADWELPQGYSLTTLGTGTEEQDDCVCPSGTYQPSGNASICKSCPEGMDCENANSSESAIFDFESSAFPAAAAGYMSMVGSPMVVFKCWHPAWCPGGRPGTCASGRDPLAPGCGACPDETWTNAEGACRSCDDNMSGFLIFLAFFAGCVCLTGVAFAVNKSTSSQPKSTATIIILSALTITAVQTLGVLESLSVNWVEPVRSMLKVLAMFSFDLDVLQTECIFGQSAARSYAFRQLVAPIAALYMLLLIYARGWVLRKYWATETDVLSQSVNAVGAAYQAFFVSIVVSITLPFVCYAHPGDAGHSMTSQPSVMCFTSSEHIVMLVVGCISFLVSAAPFIALVSYATFTYRTRSTHPREGARHLTIFRFLFFRFKPEYYYYGSISLLRSALVCLVPAIARDVAAAQLAMITMIFQVFLLIQLFIQPWRSDVANLTDAVLSCLMVLLITCVAMAGEYEGAGTVSGGVAAAVVVSMFLCCVGMGLWMLYKKMRPTPYFNKFICHHKADAAAQARYLQLCIRLRLQESCFIDSDHLQNLDNLLDTVRCQIRDLVTLLTSETLRRPWCAAEVTTAFETHRRAIRVRTASFLKPRHAQISASRILEYVHPSNVNMTELGITVDNMAAAYAWLLSDDTDEILLQTDILGTGRFQQVVTDLSRVSSAASKKRPSVGSNSVTGTNSSASNDTNGEVKRMKSTVTMEKHLRPGALLVSSLPGSDEAAAGAGIIAVKLQTYVAENIKEGICLLCDIPSAGDADILEVACRARCIVALLSEGSLRSSTQLALIGAVLGPGTVAGPEVVPVCTPNFRFPDATFYESLRANPITEPLCEAVQQMFKHIAINLATHGSESVLDAQCKDIISRIPTFPRFGVVSSRPCLSSAELEDALEWDVVERWRERRISRSARSSTISSGSNSGAGSVPLGIRTSRTSIPDGPPLAPSPLLMMAGAEGPTTGSDAFMDDSFQVSDPRAI